MSERVRPFHSGMQSADWEDCNCPGCTKAHQDHDAMTVRDEPCVIRKALFFAYWSDGTVSAKIADMMGAPDGRYAWPCPSRDPMWLEGGDDER